TSPSANRLIASSGSETAAWKATLLVPQRLDRREPDRPPGRIRGAQDADAERERKPPREDAVGEVRLQQRPGGRMVREDLGGRVAERQTDGESEQADPQRLADDQRRDFARAPADGAQDADLANPLEDRHRHRVRDRDPADNQREQRDDPAGRDDYPARGIDLDDLARLGDGGCPREVVLEPVRNVARPGAERDGDRDRRHVAGPPGQALHDAQRQDDAAVLEWVACVEDAADSRGAAAEGDRATGPP